MGRSKGNPHKWWQGTFPPCCSCLRLSFGPCAVAGGKAAKRYESTLTNYAKRISIASVVGCSARTRNEVTTPRFTKKHRKRSQSQKEHDGKNSKWTVDYLMSIFIFLKVSQSHLLPHLSSFCHLAIVIFPLQYIPGYAGPLATIAFASIVSAAASKSLAWIRCKECT